MNDINKNIQKCMIFYEGKTRTVTEAGALLIRHMIELDLNNAPEYNKSSDPYKWLADKMNKSDRAVRYWAIDWDSPGGAKPTIIDFINLMNITKSRRPLEFLGNLVSESTPEQQMNNHGNTMLKASGYIRELADTLEMLAKENK